MTNAEEKLWNEYRAALPADTSRSALAVKRALFVAFVYAMSGTCYAVLGAVKLFLLIRRDIRNLTRY